MELNQAQIDQELKERLEHRDVLLDIQSLLGTKAGRGFVKYLFKEFEVGKLPVLGLEGNILMDKLGSLRAGVAIFEIVSEANPDTAAILLAQIEKEKYVQIHYDQTR